jgi:hypothetical protein
VLNYLLDAAMSVLPRILEQFAKVAVGQPFPNHWRLGRGQVPIQRSRRHVDPRQVMVLVTTTALNRIPSLPVGSAPDLHRMLMAVVSLARKISARVTIHAARGATLQRWPQKQQPRRHPTVRPAQRRVWQARFAQRHQTSPGRRLMRMKPFAYSSPFGAVPSVA